MTALSDALAQAQRAALAALAKRYIAGKENETNARILLDSFGGTDELEQEYLLSCWAYLREAGVQAPVPEPQSYRAERKVIPATDAQRGRAKQDLMKMGRTEEEAKAIANGPLTRDEAHELISSVEDGSYDENRWQVLPDALR